MANVPRGGDVEGAGEGYLDNIKMENNNTDLSGDDRSEDAGAAGEEGKEADGEMDGEGSNDSQGDNSNTAQDGEYQQLLAL